MADRSSAKSLADPVLLETINNLFQHNIGEYVALPQKERNDGVSVSVLPTANAHPDHADKLRKYQRNLESLDQPTFAEILGQVHKLMGLREPGVLDEGAETFSDNVLKIEICGPKQQHLSVIDVPGIFRNTTAGLTTDADMDVVRNMVNNYMKNPRSVILAVIPANVDIATQEILKMAEKCDTEGQRTLGVLTKPDLVDRGAENSVVDLVQGRNYKLKLGWSMVKNPGQLDLKDPTFDRHASEKNFFKGKEPWSRLQKDRVGFESLQGQLRDILSEMVKKEFPNVKHDINKRLSERRKQLKSLGPCRETREQQHEYLLNLATRFQNTTFLARAAHYGADDLFDGIPGLKLATIVVNRNATFADDVWKKGHTMAFSQGSQSSEHSEDDAEESKDDDVEDNDPEDDDVEDSDEQSYRVRLTEPEPELDDILHDDCKAPKPKPTGIILWLNQVYKGSRGFELGTFDASILPNIWKKQSANWNDLALGYVNDIVSLVHKYTVTLLSAICDDQHVQSALVSVLMDGLVERYKKSIDHAKFILHVEKLGTPLTANHYFADNLEICRQQRMKALIDKSKFTTSKHGEVVKVDIILRTATASNADHVIRELHDILKSYYKVARKRFVDLMCMQAVDHRLITGPTAPISLFSPSFVSKLDKDQLERIAGEDNSTRRKREELRREIENLTDGKKILV